MAAIAASGPNGFAWYLLMDVLGSLYLHLGPPQHKTDEFRLINYHRYSFSQEGILDMSAHLISFFDNSTLGSSYKMQKRFTNTKGLLKALSMQIKRPHSMATHKDFIYNRQVLKQLT